MRGAATRSRQQAALSAEQLTIAWQAASLLLDYPSEELLDHVALVRSASRELPDRLGDPLRGFADHVERTPLADLQAEYVELGPGDSVTLTFEIDAPAELSGPVGVRTTPGPADGRFAVLTRSCPD